MKKILLIILSLLLSLGIANATINDSQVYYSFDSDDVSGATLIDISGFGNNGTCSNMGGDCNTVPGHLLNASEFDGTDDIVDSGVTPANSFTINSWVNFDSLTNSVGIFSTLDSTTGRDGLRLYYNNINGLTFVAYESNSVILTVNEGGTGTFSPGTWYFLSLTYNGSEVVVYLDNVELMSNSGATAITTHDANLHLGPQYLSLPNPLDGDMDEFSLYNRTLLTSEISQLYNSGNGLNPYFVSGAIITFNNPINNAWLNDTNFLLNVSFDKNTNSTYSLNGAANVTLGTNANNATANVTGVANVYNNITVHTNTGGDLTESEITFGIDTVAPNISVIGNLTQNEFEVNFSTIFNVTDAFSGLASCTLNATYLENITNASQYNQFVNCTDTTTFQAAGLYNGFLLAIDNAGNTANLSVNGTIEPVVYLNFLDSSNVSITNYDVIIFHPSGFVQTFTNTSNPVSISPFFNGSLDLGTYNITFEKLGYATNNYTLEINVSSGGDVNNFTVENSQIILKIYDRETRNLLTGLTQIDVIAPVGFAGNTTTGLLNISNILFVAGEYQILASHDGYSSETVFFTYDNQQELEVDIYMLNSTAVQTGNANVRVTAFPSGLFIKGATCSLMEWVPSLSAFSTVGQGVSDVDGVVGFKVELDTKVYKALCNDGTRTNDQLLGNGGIISITDTTTPIYLSDEEDVFSYKFQDVIFTFTNSTETNTTQRMTFTWSDVNNLVSQGCIKTFSSTGFTKTELSSNCVSSSSSEIQIIVDINNTYDLIVEAILIDSDNVETPVGIITFQGTENLESVIKKYHLDLIIPILLFFIGVAAGLVLDPENIYISLITLFVLEWVAFLIVPSVVSFTTVFFISTILGALMWGVYSGRR